MRSAFLALAATLVVGGCATSTIPEVNRLTERTGVITLPDPETGACRANDVTPAVIDTVTEQVLIAPAEYGTDGSVQRPALYETRTRQVIVEDRKEQQFDALCEAELTPAFITDLQRALGARGFYNGPVSGDMNWRTRRAIRLYQLDQGIDSAILSRRTAEALGLSAYNFEG